MAATRAKMLAQRRLMAGTVTNRDFEADTSSTFQCDLEELLLDPGKRKLRLLVVVEQSGRNGVGIVTHTFDGYHAERPIGVPCSSGLARR